MNKKRVRLIAAGRERVDWRPKKKMDILPTVSGIQLLRRNRVLKFFEDRDQKTLKIQIVHLSMLRVWLSDWHVPSSS
jgi:hypothetical protein